MCFGDKTIFVDNNLVFGDEIIIIMVTECEEVENSLAGNFFDSFHYIFCLDFCCCSFFIFLRLS